MSNHISRQLKSNIHEHADDPNGKIFEQVSKSALKESQQINS